MWLPFCFFEWSLKKPGKWLKPLHMGTHLKVLSESFPMNTIWQGFDEFQKSLLPRALDEGSLSIVRVNGVTDI